MRPGPSGHQSAQGAAHGSQPRRTTFVLLLLGLLGGGLVCLLVVNTTLAANSIEIANLQQQNAARTERIQELQQQIGVERAASTIEKEAAHLGMRPDTAPLFVDLRTKSIQGPPGTAGAAPKPVSGSSARTKQAGRLGQ